MSPEPTIVEEPRTWKVVGAICGNCVFVKQNLTEFDAVDFVSRAPKSNGTVSWQFRDGEAFFAQAGTCAVWSRREEKQ